MNNKKYLVDLKTGKIVGKNIIITKQGFVYKNLHEIMNKYPQKEQWMNLYQVIKYKIKIIFNEKN